ncbi:hypothetical protein M408DRAFT_330630 [Serendipita vermifera MAFF 305830]|uniref:Uncharacterized protein n=1 Tax=Serendipita vermifera MAFF 305830 TaxID=933852 RepID=A0A0C2WIM8_SERVB|nr:hypothetical protein M408DRAFT_330630 [Serendipita vermifera MAFF 305830]
MEVPNIKEEATAYSASLLRVSEGCHQVQSNNKFAQATPPKGMPVYVSELVWLNFLVNDLVGSKKMQFISSGNFKAAF